MKKKAILLVSLLLAGVVAVGAVALAQEEEDSSKEAIPDKVIYPQPWPGWWQELPYLIEELEGIPPNLLFTHFLGAEVRITDQDSRPHTLYLVGGTVSATTDVSLTIDPYGQSGTMTFIVTGNTVIKKGGQWVRLRNLKPKDQVLVATVDGKEKASVLLSPGPLVRPEPPIPYPLPEPRSFPIKPEPVPLLQEGKP